jgi:FtsH-binding integral membrane protein
MGYMVMMITAWYKVESVLLALAITAACSFSIALFACQTKHDLTSMIGFMFIAGMVLFFFGIVAVLSLSIWHIKVKVDA